MDFGERCRLSQWVSAEPGHQTYFGAMEAKTGTGSRALQNGQIYLQIIIYLIYDGK